MINELEHEILKIINDKHIVGYFDLLYDLAEEIGEIPPEQLKDDLEKLVEENIIGVLSEPNERFNEYFLTVDGRKELEKDDEKNNLKVIVTGA